MKYIRKHADTCSIFPFLSAFKVCGKGPVSREKEASSSAAKELVILPEIGT